MTTITINKQTGWWGIASPAPDGGYWVWEGNPDGTDDKKITAAEFQKNYWAKEIAGEETKEEYEKLAKEAK